MNYNMDAEDAYRRLIYQIMDIREAQKLKVQILCDMADITIRNYEVLFYRISKRKGMKQVRVNTNIKSLLAVVDALGYELVLKKKEDGWT